MLTGKYRDGSLPADSRAADASSPFLHAEQVATQAAEIARLQTIANEAGMPLTQLALRWLLSRQEITSVLIGARTVQQLEQCAAAAGQEPLPQDVMELCEPPKEQ